METENEQITLWEKLGSHFVEGFLYHNSDVKEAS